MNKKTFTLKQIVLPLCLIATGMLLSFAIFMLWVKYYPLDYDPKNIEYVLWKHGLNKNMNLDHALAAMTHDTWAVKQVENLSQAGLNKKFGYVKSLSEARPYDQLCYKTPGTLGELNIPAAGQDVVFLRDSDWMVILRDGKAADLVLCKGF